VYIVIITGMAVEIVFLSGVQFIIDIDCFLCTIVVVRTPY
jgi:hypothetical protein